MKNIKKLCFSIAVLLIISSLFCCNVFAENDGGYVIDTDVIYAKVPEGYGFSLLTDEYYNFSNDEWNSLSYIAFENVSAPEGITKLKEKEVQEILFDCYLADGYDSVQAKYDFTRETKVNGLSSYMIQGSYIYKDEPNFKYPFCAYLFATKENIVVVVYEDAEDAITDYDDINKALSALEINGTFFKGDSSLSTHDFSGALSFNEALENDLKEYINDGEILPEMGEEFIGIMKVTFIAMFIVPFIVILVVAVIMIVLYIKNKKILQKYEDIYGKNPLNPPTYNYNQSYNQSIPVNNGYSPYKPNFPGTPTTYQTEEPAQNNQVNPTQDNNEIK